MDIQPIHDLFNHMEWADATVWRAVSAAEAARSDDKIRGLCHHVHVVQRAFLGVWRGEAFDGKFPEFDDSVALMNWGRSIHEELREYLSSVGDAELDEPMPMPWANLVEARIGRPPAPTTKGTTMLQVVLHSTHHRGQILARLRETGSEPPMTDYIAWVWTGRPEPEWPEAH